MLTIISSSVLIIKIDLNLVLVTYQIIQLSSLSMSKDFLATDRMFTLQLNFTQSSLCKEYPITCQRFCLTMFE